MIRALIIDDEKLSRDLIKAFLKPYGDIEIIGECENGFEGIKAITEQNPDLIFLDIQMPKLTGFEMLELLEGSQIPAIIFSTAYDQFALKAFDLSAADYLLKPYTEKRFGEGLEKALRKIGMRDGNEESKEVLNNLKRESTEILERIVVRNGSKITIIPVTEIEFIKAEDDFVEIYTNGKKFLKQMTMKFLTAVLPPKQFVRIHRSYLINIDQINQLEAYAKDSYLALLKNGEKIPVSKAGYQSLKEVLDF